MSETREIATTTRQHQHLLELHEARKNDSPLVSVQTATEKKADTSGYEIIPLVGHIKEAGKEHFSDKKAENESRHLDQKALTETLKNFTSTDEKEANPLSTIEIMAKSLLARPEIRANARISNAWSSITPELQPSDLQEYRVDIGGRNAKSDRFVITCVPGLAKNERCLMIRHLNPNTRRAHNLDKWIVVRYNGNSPAPAAITTGKVDEAHYKDKVNKKWLQHTWINTWNENMERFVHYTSWEQLTPEEISAFLSKFKQAQDSNIQTPKKYAKTSGFNVCPGRLELHEALMGNNPYLITNWEHTKYDLEDLMHEFIVLFAREIWLAIANPRLLFEWLMLTWKEEQDMLDNYLKLHASQKNKKMRAKEHALPQNIDPVASVNNAPDFQLLTTPYFIDELGDILKVDE